MLHFHSWQTDSNAGLTGMSLIKTAFRLFYYILETTTATTSKAKSETGQHFINATDTLHLTLTTLPIHLSNDAGSGLCVELGGN